MTVLIVTTDLDEAERCGEVIFLHEGKMLGQDAPEAFSRKRARYAFEARGSQHNRPASLQILLNGRNSNTALLALNYAQNIVLTFNEKWHNQHGNAKPPAILVQRAWFNATLNSHWFIIVGIVVLLNPERLSENKKSAPKNKKYTTCFSQNFKLSPCPLYFFIILTKRPDTVLSYGGFWCRLP